MKVSTSEILDGLMRRHPALECCREDILQAFELVLGTYQGGGYTDASGKRKYQGTFVGFFPADDPKYSVICTVFSKPTNKQFQGGGIPARAIKSLVNGMYAIDPCFQPVLTAAK